MSIIMFRYRKLGFVLIGLVIFAAQQALAEDWRPGVPRTAYVNLFEWSWPSIAQECISQLGPKGYAAVQVSPPQEHIKGTQWWIRYQPVSYKIFSRSGDRHQFSLMVKACKAAGVDVYVDTVINHMAGGIRGIGTAGSFYGNYNYPAVPYTVDSFHQPSCTIKLPDYDNQRINITQCDIPGLPDLDTGKAAVQNTIAAYMKDLLSLGVAGFRIDAAKHIKPEELAAIKAKIPGDYFFTQEIKKDASVYNSGDVDRYLALGTVNEFSFMYAMKNMFLNLFGYNLSRMPEAFASWGMFPSEKATVFVNNHDSERSFCDKFAPGAVCDSLSLFNGDQLFLANIFMLGYPYGYPQVMSGFYFADQDMGPMTQPYRGLELTPSNCSSDPLAVGKWDCVHRDNRVANMVGFRNYTDAAPLLKWSSEGQNRIAFNRGNKGFIAINNTATVWEKAFAVAVPDAKYCNILMSDFPETGICPEHAKVEVIDGQAEVAIAPNSGLALHFGAIVKADSIADIPLINIADSLNLARGQEIISRKTKYIGLKPVLLSIDEQVRVSVAGGAFSAGPVWVKPGQSLVLKTTAPITDHTVKLVKIALGSKVYLWKLATSGAVCSDSYCPTITPVDYTPSIITAGKPVTLFYLGSLANSATLMLRWGYNGSSELADVVMTRRNDGFWSATITPPVLATSLHFVVTDGVDLDTNAGSNWNLPVVPAVDTSVTITFKVTANTLPGESVYIVGNRPELGNWSTLPDSSRQCAASLAQQWICSIRFPVGGVTIEYKYQKIGNGNLTWENGNNYTYLLPNANAEVDNGVFR